MTARLPWRINIFLSGNITVIEDRILSARHQVARQWARQDPAALNQFLATTTVLTDQQKQAVTTAAQSGGKGGGGNSQN